MKPKTLIRIGRALYGNRYMAPLARDLSVANRTVERWGSGVYNISPGRVLSLRKLLEKRCKAIGALLDHPALKVDAAGK